MRFDHLDDVRRAPASALWPLRLEVATTAEAFDALRGEWRWLWSRCAGTHAGAPPEWPSPRAAGAPNDFTLWGVTLRSEGRLVGFAPLAVHREEGLRVVRLLGAGREESLDVLMDRELAPHGTARVLEWLAQRQEQWDVCVFEPLREGAHLLRAPVPGSWDERLETWEWPGAGGAPTRTYRRLLEPTAAAHLARPSLW